MQDKIEKVLNKWSMKYKQLHATGEDIVIESSDFDHIAQELVKLFSIHNVSDFSWTDNDIDTSYIMGVMNAGTFDDLKRELDRLNKMGVKPHEAVAKVRGKRIKFN